MRQGYFRRSSLAIACGIFSLPSCTALAAIETADIYDLSLEELLQVNISTNRAPADSKALSFKVTVITEQEIRQQLALGFSTSQVLANLVPSFAPARQKLSVQGETLRGGSPLIMIDGIPQSNPLRDVSRDGHVIDLEMVKSIEVIYGANAMQGMGATGGIINFITHDTSDTSGSRLSSTVNFSDHPSSDTRGYKLGFMHNAVLGPSAVLVAGTLEEQGLFQDGNGKPIGLEQIQGDIQDTCSRDLFLKASHRQGQHEFEFTVNDYEIKSHGKFLVVPGNTLSGQLTSIKPGETQGTPPGNRVKNVAVDYRNSELLGGEISAKVFWQEFAATFGATNTAIFQDAKLGPNLYDQSQMHSEKYGTKLSFYTAQLADTLLDLTAGLDLLDDKNSQPLLMTKRIWSPEMHFRNQSPFLQGDYHFTEKFTLNATIRRELAKLSVNDFQTIATSGNTLVSGGELEFNETIYNLGAIYQLTPQLNLLFNDGEGFGMPDAGRELRAINKPGLNIEDIFSVSPLLTRNREWGLFHASNRWQGQLSYFQSETKHGNQLQLVDGVYRLNRRPSKTSGWELSSRWQVFDNTQLKLLYADTQGEFDSNGDGNLDSDLTALDIPPRRFVVSWSQQWPQQWTSHIQWTNDASRDFQTRGATTASFAGYNLLDASFARTSRWGDFSIGIANITNRQYTTYFTQVVQRNDRFFAGQGRSFHLQYRINF